MACLSKLFSVQRRSDPSEIVSFITSAIQNCVTMFGDTLQFASVYLEPQHLLQYHDFVEDVYEHFRSGVGGRVEGF